MRIIIPVPPSLPLCPLSLSPYCPFSFHTLPPPFSLPQIQLGCLGSALSPAEFEFGAFKMKNLASGEKNFHEIPEEHTE